MASDPGRPPTVEAVEEEPWDDPDRVIAVVNEKPITQGEFYRRVLRQFGTAKLLAGVVTQEVVLQEAAKRGLQATREEIEAKVDEILAEEERRAGGVEALAGEYAKIGVTLAEVRRDHAREIETQILLSKLVRSLRKVNEDLLREYYKQTYANARYRTRHIAYSFLPREGQSEADRDRLKLEAYTKAARAADRIRKGADFAGIARAESDDAFTAGRGGEMPPVQEDRLPEYMRKVLSLPVNEVSDPIENPGGGYHVFQVTGVIPSESFVDCKERIREEILTQEPTDAEVGSVLMALRKEADVRILASPREPSYAQAGAEGTR